LLLVELPDPRFGRISPGRTRRAPARGRGSRGEHGAEQNCQSVHASISLAGPTGTQRSSLPAHAWPSPAHGDGPRPTPGSVTSSPRVVEPPAAESPRRFRALALIAAGELLAMSLWFSGSAVAPAISTEWGLGATGIAWLTLSVQLGFVLGTL